MPQAKTFDRADLMRFFCESGDASMIGRFRVIFPAAIPSLFGETETKIYPVQAETIALWCERYRFAIVVQKIVFPDGGDNMLPREHPLLQEKRVTVRYGDGGSSSWLVRWVAELADAFREEMRGHVPRTIDLTSPYAAVAHGQPQAEVQPDAGDAGDQVAAEDDVAAQIDDDHTPTGTSIDDMLGDEGSAIA